MSFNPEFGRTVRKFCWELCWYVPKPLLLREKFINFISISVHVQRSRFVLHIRYIIPTQDCIIPVDI